MCLLKQFYQLVVTFIVLYHWVINLLLTLIRVTVVISNPVYFSILAQPPNITKSSLSVQTNPLNMAAILQGIALNKFKFFLQYDYGSSAVPIMFVISHFFVTFHFLKHILHFLLLLHSVFKFDKPKFIELTGTAVESAEYYLAEKVTKKWLMF